MLWMIQFVVAATIFERKKRNVAIRGRARTVTLWSRDAHITKGTHRGRLLRMAKLQVFPTL